MTDKRILILGATGRTGKLLLSEAIARGYQVNCLVRKPEKIKLKSDALTVFKGDTTSQEDLMNAVQGCDAIVSALNISRTSDFPWSPLRTPKKFLSDTMEQVLRVAKQNGVKKLVVCSAWGVAETKHDLPKWFAWFINNSNIGVAYKDHERQEALLEASNLNYTIVRPVGLTNSKKPQSIVESVQNQPKPKLLISRLSVARYMIEALSKTAQPRSKVVIFAS